MLLAARRHGGAGGAEPDRSDGPVGLPAAYATAAIQTPRRIAAGRRCRSGDPDPDCPLPLSPDSSPGPAQCASPDVGSSAGWPALALPGTRGLLAVVRLNPGS